MNCMCTTIYDHTFRVQRHTPLLCKFYLFSSGWVLFDRIHVIEVNTKVEQEELEELRGQG